MVVVVAVLAVCAAGALAVAVVLRRRLAAQRELARVADERADAQEADALAKATALDAESTERAAATALADARAEEARLATERADAAETEERRAGERAEAAEAALTAMRAAAAPTHDGVDAAVLWGLEQARSERTWRFSVAPHPESPSVFTDAPNPLLAAVQVEIDAAREDVGAVVELDADIPDRLPVSASVLALRSIQELLADIVRRSEESTVRIRADGPDLVVDIDAVDEHGARVLPAPLPIPPSAVLEVTPTGVRIVGAPTDEPPDG